MRTTINLDGDVLVAVQEQVRREQRSAGKVLSEPARQALTSRNHPDDDRPVHHGVRSLPHRGEAVSDALTDRLCEEGPGR